MPRLVVINEASLSRELEGSFLDRPGFAIIQIAKSRDLAASAVAPGNDLVIAGMTMPDMTGPRFCRIVRAAERGSLVPILVVGGSPGDSEEATRAGASGVVPDPWSRAQLFTALRTLLPVVERKGDRLPISLKVVCEQDLASYVAFTRDLSPTGMFLKGVSPAKPGTRLRLRMEIPDLAFLRPVEIAGEVVRLVAAENPASGARGVGVKFLDFPIEHKIPLTRFVREHLAA